MWADPSAYVWEIMYILLDLLAATRHLRFDLHI